MDVYSALGQGSEFVLRLPLAEDPHHPQSAPGREEEETTEQLLRILLVDDNEDMCRILRLTFEVDGHEVRLAHDGPTGLSMALEFHPEVALVDIGLPVWDGHELARRLRQEPALSGVVLVAITGYGMESDRVLSREAGFDHHLVKPPDFDELHEIFAAIQARRRESGAG